tara:strand:- start:144 stop:617 length:474 start_codon:yes stop_codon:yes gene_type:complete
MQKSSGVIRMAGAVGPGFAKIIKAVPYVGDVVNFGGELMNPNEPDPRQKVSNALSVGLGGAMASTATGGLDFIPAVLQVLGELGEEYGYPKTPLDPVFQAAPAFNPENYLREASYAINPNSEIPEEEDRLRRFSQVISDIGRLQEMVNDFKRVGRGY